MVLYFYLFFNIFWLALNCVSSKMSKKKFNHNFCFIFSVLRPFQSQGSKFFVFLKKYFENPKMDKNKCPKSNSQNTF